MPSKLDYLSKYLSAEDAHDSSSKKKKKKKKKKKEKHNRDYEEHVKEYDEDEAANQFPKGDIEEEDDGDIMDMPEEDRPTIVSSQDLGAHADTLLPKVQASSGTWNTTTTAGGEKNDESPPSATRSRRHDSSDDESSNHEHRRRPRKRYDSEDENDNLAAGSRAHASPPQKRRYDSEEDDPSETMRRQRRRRYDSDDEQEEKDDHQHRPKRSYDSEDDNNEDRQPNVAVKNEESGERRSKRRYDSEDESDSKHKTEASPSPQQRRRRYDSEDDEDKDSFDRRKRRRYDSDEEESKMKREPDVVQSSGRRRYDSEDDQDDNQSNGGRRQRRKRYDSSDDDDDDGRERMSSGHKAGLQNYKDFNSAEKEIQERKHHDAQAMVDKYGMGETVYRDAQGRRTQSENGQPSNEQQEEQMKNLNQGKVQRTELEMKAQEMAILQNSAFARHERDHRLEDMRKNEIRKGDPMAAYALQQESKKKQKKKKKKSKKTGDADMEEEQEVDEKPVYKGPPPKPNRFGIRPGYRWDGVDRGNGWEDKLLAKQYMSKAKEEEAYRWRSSDM